MPNAVTAADLFLEEISGKLDKIIDLLGSSAEEQPAAEPENPADAPAEKPEPKQAPAKKTAQRRRTKVDGR